MQRRRKVGGIVDRRFGEDDPSMTLEQKNIQRYVRERERTTAKNAIFDLEDEWQADEALTHLGRSLNGHSGLLEGMADRTIPTGSESTEKGSVEGDVEPDRLHGLGASGEPHLPQNQRQKSKRDVMEDLIAKSKLQKYERQKAKEDDDDLRAELDEGLEDLYSTLKSQGELQAGAQAVKRTQVRDLKINPDRLALLEGKDRSQADKEYDERLRQMLLDQRAQPSAPTLTAEQKTTRAADRLTAIEGRRLERMLGESGSQVSEDDDVIHEQSGEEDSHFNTANVHSPGNGVAGGSLLHGSLDVEDEDTFSIDDDLTSIASSQSGRSEDGGDLDLNNEDGTMPLADHGSSDIQESFVEKNAQSGLPTRSSSLWKVCPTSHDEFIQVIAIIDSKDLSNIIQCFRQANDPSTGEESKRRLGRFAGVLVEHIHHLANAPQEPAFVELEPLIRHVHSLAKTFGSEVADAFRARLGVMHMSIPSQLNIGDLIIFVAIGSIYPTSDHFHQVVTPAMLCMARYLARSMPSTYSDVATGTFVCTLCLSYQRLARRNVPEMLNFIQRALKFVLSNTSTRQENIRSLSSTIQMEAQEYTGCMNGPVKLSIVELTQLKRTDRNYGVTLLAYGLLTLIENISTIWADHPAFCESFDPLLDQVLRLSQHDHDLSSKSRIQDRAKKVICHLQGLMRRSCNEREPLRLHNHRPLAIKSSIPKFDASYNPDKHNDPNSERSELSKLKAQHKKERKGALRELRKDANFIARESLKEKKDKDAAYDKKFKRLVAEIQGEEGHESRLYERDKRMRKGKR